MFHRCLTVVLFVILSLWFGGWLRADDSHIESGDLTTQGTIPGNLHILTGGVNFASPGSLWVKGDLHAYDRIYISDGGLEVNGDLHLFDKADKDAYIDVNGRITVNGDLIMEAYENAYIHASDGMYVRGSIRIEAGNGNAYIRVTGGSFGAKSIATRAGAGNAHIEVQNGNLSVDENISLRSVGGNCDVHAALEITANNIATNVVSGSGTARVLSDTRSIRVTGDIVTKSALGTAHVEALGTAGQGFISANNITTSAGTDGYVLSQNDYIEVAGSIVTRSATGDAYVEAYSSLEASSIMTYASGGDAYVKSTNNGNIKVVGAITTNAPGGQGYVSSIGGIEAASLTIYSASRSDVYAGTSLNCGGDIAVRAIGAGNATVRAANGYLLASSITTSAASGTAYVLADLGSLAVAGDIHTYSGGNQAYVQAETTLKAGSIDTYSAVSHSYVETAAGSINVTGNIRTRAAGSGGGHVKIAGGSGGIEAGSITTESVTGDAYVQNAGSGDIKVSGPIHTNCGGAGNGEVYAVAGNITAGSIVTNGGDSSEGGRVRADAGFIHCADSIETNADGPATVTGDTGVSAQKISTESTTSAAYVYAVTSGSINVTGDIITNAPRDAYIKATSGTITAKGDLNTNSTNENAYILASGAITARNIKTTKGSTGLSFHHSYVDSTGGGITVLGDIETYSSTSDTANVYVQADGNIAADNIVAYGGGASWVKSASGAITAKGIIKAVSNNSDAYVSAANSVSAQRITTSAPSGFDKSIKSTSGTVDAEMRTDISVNIPIALQNADLSLDKNTKLNTTMSIYGTCTLRGDGNEFELGSSGQLDVTTGSTLVLQDLRLAELSSTKLRCVTNDATIWFSYSWR